MPDENHPPMHRDQIYSRAGDPRVATSVVLMGIVAVLIGAVFMAIGPELKSNGPAVATASGDRRAAPVRTIGVPAREDAACDRQVWPNIDQRCLVVAKREDAADSKPVSTPDDAKLSPLTATGPVGKNLPAPPDGAVVAAAPSSTQDADAAPARFNRGMSIDNDEPEEAPVRRPVRRHIGFPFPFGIRF